MVAAAVSGSVVLGSLILVLIGGTGTVAFSDRRREDPAAAADSTGNPGGGGKRGDLSLVLTSNIELSQSNDNEFSANIATGPDSKTVDLTCTPRGGGLKHHSLEWWDELIPISDSESTGTYSNRELIQTQDCGLTLRIHNFSMLDYGRYHCRCVSERPSFERIGIQFDIEEMWARTHNECSENEPTVHVLPLYGTDSRPEVGVSPNPRPGLVRLQCGTFWRRLNPNNTVWTQVTENQSAIYSTGRVIHVPSPTSHTKFICHDQSRSEVYGIYYIPPYSEGHQAQRTAIIYPPRSMDHVHFQYTPENIIERDGAINLCLIHPYIPQHTISSVSYKQRNQTFRADATMPVTIASRGRGISAFVESKVLRGASTGLLYLVKINNIPQNKTEMKRSLAFIQRKLESGRFSCSMNQPRRRGKVSFRLNLTEEATERMEARPRHSACRGNKSRPTIKPTDQPTTREPLGLDLELNTSTTASFRIDPAYHFQSTAIILSALTFLAVLVIILTIVILGIVCSKRVTTYRKKKAKKMHSITIEPWQLGSRLSLQSSFCNPLASGGSDSSVQLSRQMTLQVRDMQAEGVLVPFNLLTLRGDLGSGAFGVVKKAELLDPATQTASTVAVKMLKESATSEEEKDIMMELKALHHVGRHCNVVSFLGASVHEGKLHLIVEYCARGNLLHLLRSKRGDVHDPFSIETLIAMGSQVANGMAYLTSKKCIHRDLAARNVLITEDFILKVADFGLARKIYNSVYRPSAKRLPIKWMAPEGILDGVYTSKSDVWSFGILLWEISTLGRTPYPGRAAHRVIRDIENGYRMPQPHGCPDELYSVMLRCWQMDPRARPDFVELKDILDTLIGDLSATSEQLHTNYYNVLDGGELSSAEEDSATEHCDYCGCGVTQHCDNNERGSDTSQSAHSEDEERDYVNILPRGWFGRGTSTDSYEGRTVNEFLQAHAEQERSVMEYGSAGSLCTLCQELCSVESLSSRALSDSFSVVSLCTACKEQEYQNVGDQELRLTDSTASNSLTSLCTQCRQSNSGLSECEYDHLDCYDQDDP